MGVKAVLIRISTQEILRKNVNYPSKEIVPIPSLDADLKWLIINQLDRPTFEPFTEKLVRVEEITIEAHPIYTELDQYKIYWNIVALTQDEQDAYLQQVEDNDASAKAVLNYKADGVVGFDRAYALIQRKFDNGVITGNQAKALAEGLYDALEPLYKGQWRLTKIRYNALTPPINADLLDIFTTIQTAINNYINDNY